MWSKPVVSPTGPHIVVPSGQKLELHCHDNATASSTPSSLRWQREKSRRLDEEVNEDGVVSVRVSAVQPYHMGRYVCVNNSTLEHSSIYVFVKGTCSSKKVCVCVLGGPSDGFSKAKIRFWNQLSTCPPHLLDPSNAFQRTIVNNILVKAGENCIIPCLVTDPEVTSLKLETCNGRPLPSGMKYHSNQQRGVIISNAREEYEGCYVCVGQLGAVNVKSSKYTVDVQLGEWKDYPPW